MKTISLEFKGYWLEVNKGDIPAESGIYGVYACTYNKEQRTVSLRELVYIGESFDVKSRISSHERLSDWKKRLRAGETLCYSFAKVERSNRLCAEAAVIFHHKPPCNIEYTYSFPFTDTSITATGKHAKIDDFFIVYQT